MNNAAKLSGVAAVFAALLQLVPARYAIYPAALIAVCAVLSAVIQAPAADSRWAFLYRLMTALGANILWAQNRLQVGLTGVMVPRESAPAVKAALPAILSPTEVKPTSPLE